MKSTNTQPSAKTEGKPRRLQGVVVSTAMQKTAVVRVDRRVAHAKYGKYFTISNKFKIHDPDSACKLGDVVEFQETRPISKDKHFKYLSTVSAA